MKIAQTENELADYLFDVAASIRSQAMASPVISESLRDELISIADKLHGLQSDAFPGLAKLPR